MRLKYYYDPIGSLNVVRLPGECCDRCGELARIMPAGSMIPMPCDSGMEEYGKVAGDVHMHPECAERTLSEYKQLAEEAECAIRTWREAKR